MEGLKYVSPEYQAQLDALAETLMQRFAKPVGQLALFEEVELTGYAEVADSLLGANE
ncbi:hypothetical protein [Caudoviricetes sp.]|nr:hypothetical protein [Caudoviricetes sp.]